MNWLVIIFLFTFYFLIGSYKTDQLPNTLNQDEIVFVLGASNLSNTGYDLCKTYIPLFPCAAEDFEYRGTTISYYLNALFYKFYSPADIGGIRIFSIFVGAVAGVVFFLISRAILKESKYCFFYSILFSILFYLSPGFFIIQRFGAPYYAISLLLQLFLFFLIYKFSINNKKYLILLISLVTSLLMLDYQLYRFYAPFYFILFILIFRKKVFFERLKDNRYFILGFTIFLITLFFVVKQTLFDQFTSDYYFHNFNFYNLVVAIFYYLIVNFLMIDVSFFNSFWYGLFQFSTILFLIFGLKYIWRNFKNDNNFARFIFISFLAYFLGAILINPTPFFPSQRVINLIPIYFIICLYSVYTLEKPNYVFRAKISGSAVVFISLFLILFQTTYFVYDYFYVISRQNNYCRISSYTGHGCNFKGLFDFIKQNEFSYIYFDSSLVFIDSYVRFFNSILKYNIKNYEVVDIANIVNPGIGDIVVVSKNKADQLKLDEKYHLIKQIDEPNIDSAFFYIFEVKI